MGNRNDIPELRPPKEHPGESLLCSSQACKAHPSRYHLPFHVMQLLFPPRSMVVQSNHHPITSRTRIPSNPGNGVRKSSLIKKKPLNRAGGAKSKHPHAADQAAHPQPHPQSTKHQEHTQSHTRGPGTRQGKIPAYVIQRKFHQTKFRSPLIDTYILPSQPQIMLRGRFPFITAFGKPFPKSRCRANFPALGFLPDLW